MAAVSNVERQLAADFFYNFPNSPLHVFQVGPSSDEKALIEAERLISRYLPGLMQPGCVDLEDSRIQVVFDRSMQNMVRLRAKEMMEERAGDENVLSILQGWFEKPSTVLQDEGRCSPPAFGAR